MCQGGRGRGCSQPVENLWKRCAESGLRAVTQILLYADAHDGVYCEHQQNPYASVRGILEEGGRSGFILGSDCSIGGDLPVERIRWVADAAHRL